MSRLTNKQEAFAQHYALHGSPIEAYRAAGYSKTMSAASAAVEAQKLLKKPKIAARIAQLTERKQQRIEARFDITLDKVIQELAAIGFANMQNYVDIDDDGQPSLDFSDLTPQQFAAIGELTIEDIGTVKRTKFKLLDKKAALIKLGEHLGGFKQTVVSEHRMIKDAAAEFDRRIANLLEETTTPDPKLN